MNHEKINKINKEIELNLLIQNEIENGEPKNVTYEEVITKDGERHIEETTTLEFDDVED